MTKSLSDWVDELESADLLVRVDEEIDPKYVAAVVSKNYRKATLIENIRGYEMPLLANSFSNRKMIALALGVVEERLIETLTEKMSKRVRPAMIPSHKQAACQEVVLTGEEVDLTRFPLHLQHELDGAPYISAGVLVANNPLNDATNLGIYRMMFRTKSETGIDLTAPHKLRRFFQTAMERNEGPLEVACALGLHALDMLSSEATGPDDVDEYEVLGGFRGEPVELVKCKTIDVQVPENAEIVIECEMPLEGWTKDEGPYGEFTGTYGGLKSNPVLHVKAITQRKNPIFLSATHGGTHPGWSDFYLLVPMFESTILNSLKAANIDVKALRFHPGSSGMWLIASIKKWTEGDGKNALMLMLTASNQNFPKNAVVVDDDIDIFDDEAVYWAMTMRAQPSEDVMIFNGLKCMPLDPSLPTEMPPVTTSKMGFDATRPLNRPLFRFQICKPPYLEEFGIEPEAAERHIAEEKRKTQKRASNEPSRTSIKRENVNVMRNEISSLLQRRPLYFKEVLDSIGSADYRTFLLAWSKMREDLGILVQRDTIGRYFIT